jgi:hypothetical protein
VFSTKVLGQFRGRISTASVIPQKGIANNATIFIQYNHAVLLTTNRDGLDIVESTCLSQRFTECSPPVGGVDLGALGVTGSPFANQCTRLGVSNNYFATLR